MDRFYCVELTKKLKDYVYEIDEDTDIIYYIVRKINDTLNNYSIIHRWEEIDNEYIDHIQYNEIKENFKSFKEYVNEKLRNDIKNPFIIGDINNVLDKLRDLNCAFTEPNKLSEIVNMLENIIESMKDSNYFYCDGLELYKEVFDDIEYIGFYNNLSNTHNLIESFEEFLSNADISDKIIIKK